MSKIACIILQRNMPQATKKILDSVFSLNSNTTDFFVVESGSDEDQVIKDSRLSSVFHANWEEAKVGLRTGRGMNYGLLEVQKIKEYDYYMFCTGDCMFEEGSEFQRLISLFEQNSKLGILSPVSLKWGQDLPKDRKLSLQFLVPLVCYMFRKSALQDLIEGETYYDRLFDCKTNWRMYDVDTSKVIEGYKKDWAFGITNEIKIQEDEDLIYQNVLQSKTEDKATHRTLMYQEGLKWMKEKYGFNSKQDMRAWGRYEMEMFLQRNPEMREFV